MRIALLGALLIGLASVLTFVIVPGSKTANSRMTKVAPLQEENRHRSNITPSSRKGNLDTNGKEEIPATEPKRRPTWNKTAINVLKDHPECNLSHEDILAIQKVYSRLSDARAESELKLAKATVLSSTQTMLEIPIYATAGSEMLAEFNDEVRSALTNSQANAEEVLKILTPSFVSQNNNLGQYAQKLVISQTSPDHYEVLREISVPNIGVARSTSTVTGTSPLHFAGLESAFPGRNGK